MTLTFCNPGPTGGGLAMKKILTALALLFVSGALPAQTQPRSVPAMPAGLDTSRFPIFHKTEPMSAVRMADLGLRPVRLDTAIVVFNWTEARKRFQYDTIPAGVVVAVDTENIPRYRQDCSNRLVLLPKGISAPASITAGLNPDSTSTDSARAIGVNTLASAGSGESWFSRAAGWLWGNLWGLAKLLGAILLLLVLLALAFAIGSGLVQFVRQIWAQRGLTPVVVPPAPQSVIPPVASNRRRGADRRQGGDRRRGERRQGE